LGPALAIAVHGPEGAKIGHDRQRQGDEETTDLESQASPPEGAQKSGMVHVAWKAQGALPRKQEIVAQLIGCDVLEHPGEWVADPDSHIRGDHGHPEERRQTQDEGGMERYGRSNPDENPEGRAQGHSSRFSLETPEFQPVVFKGALEGHVY
jgi:hypothetical protein